MTGYNRLTDVQVAAISEAYFQARSAKTQQQDNPRIVLVGGQPGAGKTGVSHLARMELATRGGYIHVDADRLRERIPLGTQKPSSEETQADAGRIVQSLRGLATQAKRNLIEEGTFRSPEGVGRFVRARLEQGYAVELLAVATPREESLLGIYQRFEHQHHHGTDNPRFVPQEYHDEAMQGFDATVAQTGHLMERVRVVTRDGGVLYDSLAADNPHPNALQALAEGRRLTDERLVAITKAWTAVEAAAVARHAPMTYISTVQDHASRLDELKKERIHLHAMKGLDHHDATLARDPRFAKHSESERLKAAYFRGFHERAALFSDTRPDFAKYDETVASRQTLAKLPDVDDLRGRAGQGAERRHSVQKDDSHTL